MGTFIDEADLGIGVSTRRRAPQRRRARPSTKSSARRLTRAVYGSTDGTSRGPPRRLGVTRHRAPLPNEWRSSGSRETRQSRRRRAALTGGNVGERRRVGGGVRLHGHGPGPLIGPAMNIRPFRAVSTPRRPPIAPLARPVPPSALNTVFPIAASTLSPESRMAGRPTPTANRRPTPRSRFGVASTPGLGAFAIDRHQGRLTVSGARREQHHGRWPPFATAARNSSRLPPARRRPHARTLGAPV